MSNVPQPPIERPDIWKYLQGAVVLFLILLAAYAAIETDEFRALIRGQSEMEMRKLWWIAVPALAIVVVLSSHWVSASRQFQTRQAQAKVQHELAQQRLAEARTEKGRREYVLEVIGLGVTVEKYRQGKLWDVLQKGTPYSEIREKDPHKYPWSGLEKEQTTGGREGDTLDNGAWRSPDCWGVPVFNAQPPIQNPALADSPLSPTPGLTTGAESNGMASHLFVVGSVKLKERPDRLLDDVFDFFDKNPDIPYVVLNSDDSSTVRNMFAYKRKNTDDGYFIPSMPDASVLFLLARRERVDAIRPFVFEDVSNEKSVEYQNSEGISRRLFVAYLDLKNSLPRVDPENTAARKPTISEWLTAAAKFAARPELRGNKPGSYRDLAFHIKHRVPYDWKPTPWFPVPWETFQLATFDSLPTMGFIHRPVFVNTSDEHGKPLAKLDQRRKALLAGLQEALLTLPEAERAAAPARIIAGTNNNVDQLLALEGMLHDFAELGGPSIDTGKLDQFTNTDRRLGNTGAATWFVQMGIGVMGSYRAGGVSAAINLRDQHEASIVLISPPSEEKRQAQQQARGDIFKPRNSPDIDPANYAPPSK
ncbi:type VI lipase adapter Tla3 domain-containing protein [Rugamonas rubra]|uniref:DUF2875 domain-containing protein n=1 Tax=Rugamonas rubra TaxID=758825 RepID=A0A1I4NTE9_9BURK|nr:DUF2875 family protein [Rugamonas rubra]SFM18640.1 Protein of unknown function [Rugamonas rubra]